MMDSFTAYRIHRQEGRIQGRLESITLDDLSAGDVVVQVDWSGINFKDALAATGTGKILRRFPLVGGIDLAGHVHRSSDDRFKEGDPVLVCGGGLSEDHDGGYARYARVMGDWLVPIPIGLSLREAMAIGTAGFTAAIAIDRMQHNGQQPDAGPILVNGATGGVGSFSIDLLSGLGFEVAAFTGKRDQQAYLEALGASECLYRDEVDLGTRPLEKARWAGAIDNVGGNELGWLTRTVLPMGNIASIGLAGGIKLDTTVMPFILRGVNLLGINSVLLPNERRTRVWKRLASDLKPRHIDRIVTKEIGIEQLDSMFQRYMEGGVTGRTVVRIGDD